MTGWHFPAGFGLNRTFGSGGTLGPGRTLGLSGMFGLSAMLWLDDTLGLSGALGPHGKPGPRSVLRLARDPVDGRACRTDVRAPRRSRAPLRLGGPFPLLVCRLCALSFYRNTQTLPYFLRQHRRCRLRRPASSRTARALRQLLATVFISHAGQTPLSGAHIGRYGPHRIAEHRIDGYSSEITNCNSD
jgi:hypothetical protein